MNIEFSYPIWYVFICLLIGGAYSFVLYRKEDLLNEVKNAIVYAMAFFRFITVTTLCLLLLEPLIETETEIVDKPVLIMAYDNSESILLNKDSSYYKGEFLSATEKLEQQLSDKYELKTFSFGDNIENEVNLNYEDKQTDVSEFIEDVYSRFYGRNIGAMILMTDGIVNKGSNPLYSSKKIKHTPFYTIALGDTSIRKDLIIKEVNRNRIAYKGNQFPVEVALKGSKIPAGPVTLDILKGETKVFTESVNWQEEDDIYTFKALLDAKSSGKQKYTVQVSKLEGELTYENNEQEFYIDILDNKQKILMLARAPHPDIAALKLAWEQNSNYEVEVELIKDFDGKTDAYSLVVMHDLPADVKFNNKIDRIVEQDVPMVFVVGMHTNISTFNKYNLGVSFTSPSGYADVTASYNSSFSKFSISEEVQQTVSKFPPLKIPFASGYNASSSSEVLLFQKIGSTKTDYPLFVFNEKNNVKYSFLLGEGIWRWKLEDYKQNKSHEIFNSVISKMTQYLSLKENKSKFRVYCNHEQIENESVILTAELYNDSYELVNDAEVVLSITNEEGEVYPDKIFSQSGNAYRLDVGTMEKGEYTYLAKVSFGGKTYEEKGGFRVKELKTEFLNVVADHQMLFNLSSSTGGEMFYPSELDQLTEAIFNKEDIVDISHIEKDVTDIITWKWIFALLLALLTIEWFSRKRNGAY